MPRDDFLRETKERLARRVGMRCSNPDCRTPTAGPDASQGAVNLGEAAHITAASPGGARYDSTLSNEARQDIQNGIWLCRRCSKAVDADELAYPKSTLVEWKETAELIAAIEMRGFVVSRSRPFAKLDKMLPDLIVEMRKDIREHPLYREFILMEKDWSYNSSRSDFLVYYYEDHPDLDSKVQILVNYGAAIDVTYNNTKRYNFSEDFVEHLQSSA